MLLILSSFNSTIGQITITEVDNLRDLTVSDFEGKIEIDLLESYVNFLDAENEENVFLYLLHVRVLLNQF